MLCDDGDSQRIKKSNATLYWRGLNGKVLAVSTQAGTIQTEYIYFGGRPIARRDESGAVYYFFADHLGSLRVITNATGQMQRDADFYPYGTERVVTGRR